jgi:thiol:disulfide interchange protein/DsbC/DsbD-like thiol-disulfide interchange protein
MRSLMRSLTLTLTLALLFMSESVLAEIALAASFEARDISLPASAQALAVFEEEGPQLKARLLVSGRATELASDNRTRHVGVLFDLAPGWHIYWRNPGGTGIAPSLGLDSSEGQIGEVLWPAPETFREADGLFTTYGYEERVLLSAPLLPSLVTTSAPGSVRADVNVLICRTQCVPASFVLSTPLEPNTTPEDRAWIDALFVDATNNVPVDARETDLEVVAHWIAGSPGADEEARLELSIRSCASGGDDCPGLAMDLDHAVFLPMESEIFEFSPPTIEASNVASGQYTLSMEATRLEAGSDRLHGILRVQGQNGPAEYRRVDLPILVESAATSAPVLVSAESWIEIFLLALLGGLILNGMPCVLPVLAIKVVAIADMAEKDPREVRLHGLAYTGGVLASMALLSLIVLGLRAAGHSVGWGFQFQEPLFVASISALLVAFALNLFGVYEIEFGQGRLADVGQSSSGRTRSVFEGLLAVILATPCTAPFLGTAVGFAFATSGFGIAAIFLAIGFGLASPFLIVSFFPALARFIPRSGPWMMKLRAGLGFSLLATVVWLLWVLGQSGGLEAVIAMTGNLLFLAFLLWGFGQIQPLRSAWVTRASAVSIACLAFAGFNLIDFDRVEDPANTTTADELKVGWRPWSEAAVADVVASGQTAFVVFTADWCITCQLNKHAVLERPDMRAAFEKRGVALFKADWTKRDEVIRRKLAEFGRAGVPLYLVYSPSAPDQPKVLSELLRKQDVMSALPSPDGTGRS